MTVDVIVPVHGNFDLTRGCLHSLLAQTHPVRIVVVDDASPDNTLQLMESEFPDIEVLALSENVGFAGACNEGISAREGDIVALVNNDVVADTSLAESLVVCFSDPLVGSVAPVILRPDGRIDAYGITCDRTLVGYRRLSGEPLSRLPDAACYELLGPYGAIAAYRRRALDDVGVLDQRIFMYGEELDLNIRLRQAGWSCAGTDQVGGVHLGGGSVGHGSPRHVYLAGFGRGFLMRKHRRVIGRSLVRAVLVETLICLVAMLRDRNLGAARGRVQGYRAAKGPSVRRSPTFAGVDRTIGVVESIELRGARKWKRYVNPTQSGRRAN